jgi:tetratricopeptide (TPR) repeat protein
VPDDERTRERCPDEEVIVEYAQGGLVPDERADIEAHLDGCAACADVVTGMVRIFGTCSPPIVGSAEDIEETYADGEASAGDAPLPAGTAIGRYRLLECIGAGGMGIVYAAYDPELDRRVAIKLLRTREGPQRDARNARLLREAQALARLSHPNVIAVHDVGTFADHVFVAMEFVNGENLTQWLRARPRTWPEIRDVFVAAGRGLAAAHAVGLVHRDFKPDNVLVGRDGRVRVTDFGLARIAGQLSGSIDSVSSEGRLEDTTGKIPLVTLTATGALLGTPAYMAPEQFAGGRIDATSDQYSFCVALFEAVVGARPFAARNVTQLATAVLEADPVMPTSARAPLAVRRAIVRGLSRKRTGRFPDMHALLAVLERDRSRLRRFAAAAVGVAAVSAAIGVGLGAGTTDTRPARCVGDPPLAGWNDDAILAMAARFEASGVAFSTPSWIALRDGLDARVVSLRRVHADACAVASDPSVDAEFALRRFECLDERERELAAVLEVVGASDAELVRDAVRIPETLEDASTCDDADALARERVQPPDPRLVSRVDAARIELERAAALEVGGRYEDALAATATALAEAEATGYEPLRAEVLARRGILLDRLSRSGEALTTLYQAAAVATANRHHAAAARAWIELVYVLGRHEHRFAEGRVAAAQAEAELTALGGDDDMEAARLTNVGTLAYSEGHIDEGLGFYERALELRERLGQPLKQADVLFNVANVELTRGDYESAEAHLLECLRRWQAVVGTAHPDTLDVIHSLGVLYEHSGRFEEAREQLELALRLRSELIGSETREAASSASALGRTLVYLGRHDEGIALARRAVATYERMYGADHSHVAIHLGHLGEALWVAGRKDEAKREMMRAIAMQVAALGEAHPGVANGVRVLASFYARDGQRDEAERILRRTLAHLEAEFGRDNAEVEMTRTLLEAIVRGDPLE